MSETIGFIGLGTLGQPMARNLLQSGYHLKIYNRTASKKERVRPLLQVLGQGIFDFGETPGAALLAKLCGNFLIVAAGRAMAEALTLAKKSGTDPAQVITMLTQTLFTAPIYQNYGPRIAADPEHYTANWIALKDVGLFNAVAGQVEANVPLAARLLELLQL